MLTKEEYGRFFYTFAQEMNWQFRYNGYGRFEVVPETEEQLEEMQEYAGLMHVQLMVDDKRLRELQLLKYESSEKELLYRMLKQKGYDVRLEYDEQRNMYFIFITLDNNNQTKRLFTVLNDFEGTNDFVFISTKSQQENEVDDMNYRELLTKLRRLEEIEVVIEHKKYELEVFALTNDGRRKAYYLQKEYEEAKNSKGVYITFNMSRVQALSEEDFFLRIREFSAFVQKYHGFVELRDKTNILAYYSSEKTKAVIENKFREFWYTKLELGEGKTSTLSLTLSPLYPSGSAWTMEEWQTIGKTIQEKISKFGMSIRYSTSSHLEIVFLEDEQVKYNSSVYKYAHKWLITENGERVKTKISFVKA
ncbi:hypothetical protein SAMN02745116_01408 [Pilibacter termitis]|uniref:Uncharacterized protein n=1 Tax=Pilibacter termitis TaxID=263852 RepID=A0A1T4NF62_9ENTE|nr:hypothetical protein [Pilibacter termitis]SJZ77753.1 hypothetical protein SAMN02745116_01408 [Pilibacter termitis]